MTAKEYFAKRNGGKTPNKMENDNEFVGAMWCQKLMSNFAIHIAKQAVKEIKMKGLPDKPISYYRIHELACDRILTRIKTLTQGE